jgi:ferritin-like metal-binding protein YciE
MFEHFDTPQEAYNFKLGAALTMEKTAIEILEANIAAAQDDAVKSLLEAHLQETRGHVENLEQVFGCFEWAVDDSPCPTIEALQKEGASMVKKTDDSFVDSVILMGAGEVEHHEIAVYEGLITSADAMGRQDVVDLLQKNLTQEQAALEKASTQLKHVVAVSPKPTAA